MTILKYTSLINDNNLHDLKYMGGVNIETFEINRSTDGQFYFTLKAQNHEVIATSEMYTTKESCQNGINSVKTNAPNAEVVDNTF